jgi:hypothetical protein
MRTEEGAAGVPTRNAVRLVSIEVAGDSEWARLIVAVVVSLIHPSAFWFVRARHCTYRFSRFGTSW